MCRYLALDIGAIIPSDEYSYLWISFYQSISESGLHRIIRGRTVRVHNVNWKDEVGSLNTFSSNLWINFQYSAAESSTLSQTIQSDSFNDMFHFVVVFCTMFVYCEDNICEVITVTDRRLAVYWLVFVVVYDFGA